MWLVIVLLFFLAYWLLYSPHHPFKRKQAIVDNQKFISSLPPSSSLATSYTYSLIQNHSRNVTISASYGGSWTFEWDDDRYAFGEGRVFETDDCFGKPDGSKVLARQLSDYKGLDPSYEYFFYCDQNRIRGLYVRLQGHLEFHPVADCSAPYQLYPDPVNKSYYLECEDGKPMRKECPPDTFFWIDACENVSEICVESKLPTVFINNKTFINCVDKTRVEQCPENTVRLPTWPTCELDSCLGVSDEKIRKMSNISMGPFVYSPGYFVCRDHRVVESITCPSEWNPAKSHGDDLTRLPKVFDPQLNRCSEPHFCVNVRSSDETTVVPVHEFTKHVQNWPYSELFDSTIGYRCLSGTKIRFVLEPGQKILNYTIVSACDNGTATKVPIGDRVDAYYDCQSGKTIECGPGKIFSGKGCRNRIAHAHTFKNYPLFRTRGLSRRNNWMKPFEVSSSVLNPTFVSNYGAIIDSDCEAYAFLKQIPKDRFFYLPDGKHLCKYSRKLNKILKKPYDTTKKLHFWSQRLVPITEKDEVCEFGRRLDSGDFYLDSTVYATCTKDQPFVFCPSTSTHGIDRAPNGTFACVPENHVHWTRLEGTQTFLTWAIDHIEVHMDGIYKIDEGETAKLEHVSDGRKTVVVLSRNEFFMFWSNRPYVVYFRRLSTYPPNVYLENQKLKTVSSDPNMWYWIRKRKETKLPFKLPDHTVEESIKYN